MFWQILACSPSGMLQFNTDTGEFDTAEEVVESRSGLQSQDEVDTGSDAFILPQVSSPFQRDNPGLNVLVVVADDVGIEASTCYEDQIHASRAPQPTIQGLCSSGLTFTDVWSYPLCSPTRAAMMTGRHSWRTGVGRALDEDTEPLSTDEVSVADVVGGENGYFGKWHLTGRMDTLHPNNLGWSHFAGTLHGSVPDYSEYVKVTNGALDLAENYATTETVDDAIAWLSARESEDPWVMWVAFNAPHTPLHEPPADLHANLDTSGLTNNEQQLAWYQAMIEAMDTELGRLLDEVDRDNTVVIYVSDNGTDPVVNQSIYKQGHGKGTLYQGGVHVPLIISGPGIPAGRVDAMVEVVDLYSTIIELTGAEVPDDVELDSISLTPYFENPDATPLRDTMFTEIFGLKVPGTVGGRAVLQRPRGAVQPQRGPHRDQQPPGQHDVRLLAVRLRAPADDPR